MMSSSSEGVVKIWRAARSNVPYQGPFVVDSGQDARNDPDDVFTVSTARWSNERSHLA